MNLTIDQPLHPDKGKLHGRCNRRACQAPDAHWWSDIEHAAYCTPCARDINTWRPKGTRGLFYVEPPDDANPPASAA